MKSQHIVAWGDGWCALRDEQGQLFTVHTQQWNADKSKGTKQKKHSQIYLRWLLVGCFFSITVGCQLDVHWSEYHLSNAIDNAIRENPSFEELIK